MGNPLILQRASAQWLPLPLFYTLLTERYLRMDMFSPPWWSALLSIVLIDLVLAGDNAILI